MGLYYYVTGMVSRRTRARLELLGNISSLVALVFLYNRSSDTDPPSPRWLLVGAISMLPYSWAVDRDWRHTRSSYRQRALSAVGWTVIQQVLLPDEESAKHGFSIGMLAGSIVYRLWYGLLRPLPGTNHD